MDRYELMAVNNGISPDEEIVQVDYSYLDWKWNFKRQLEFHMPKLDFPRRRPEVKPCGTEHPERQPRRKGHRGLPRRRDMRPNHRSPAFYSEGTVTSMLG